MNGPTETPHEAARRLAASAIRDGYKPEALHTYTYPDGGPWYWRIRLKNPDTGEKWIRPMRRNGAGYELKEPDFPQGKPLYRLNDLAARPQDGVMVVEGEWCADALAKVGALATTSGAADSAGKADWRPMAGRCATIWPDNHEAGRRYAEAVADALLALGCTVRVIDVDKLELPEKGDAVDWLKANAAATAADIAALPCVEGKNDRARETNEQAVVRLASMKPMDYDRVRQAEADALEVRVTTLDAEVAKMRPAASAVDGQGAVPLFVEVAPWPHPVNGAELLKDLAALFLQYVFMPAEASTILGLWVVHTFCYDLRRCTPILGLTSPQRRCGKTTLMSLLLSVVNRPLAASNISPSCVFRAIDLWRPTLLIDEADSFLLDNEELRGILNSGHTRELAYVLRTSGEEHEPRRFSTWAPKALALIGKLPPTLHDRAILVELARKTPEDRVKRLQELDSTDLRRRCLRWAEDHTEKIKTADPNIPAGTHDRSADNWAPLLAIADAAGGDWPARARQALAAQQDEPDDSAGVMLLADIREFFDQKSLDKATSAALVTYLVSLEESPWSEWGRARKPISQRQIAGLLKPFKIKPGKVRVGEPLQGYHLKSFKDAFSRYLPPSRSGTPEQTKQNAGSRGFQSGTPESNVPDGVPLRPAPQLRCSGVLDGAPPYSGEEDEGRETGGSPPSRGRGMSPPEVLMRLVPPGWRST